MSSMNTVYRTGPLVVDALGAPPDDRVERPIQARLARQAALAVGVVAAIVLAWAALAPLRGAIIAPGFVKTELNRKVVQHQEGGIVREILVREGQRVKAGDALLTVGDTRSDALLSLYEEQRLSESIRHARLSAEHALAAGFELPAGIDPGPAAQAYLARERTLFDARRKTLTEQIASLQAQRQATEGQLRALASQIEATRRGADLARDELDMHRGLARDGYVQRTRLLALERTLADYDSRVGEQGSELEQARQRLGDLQLRIVQAQNQYRQQAAAELKDAATRLAEIDEQLRPARDLATRQVVRAPVDGEVMSLRVAAVGESVAPRQPLLEVVPSAERLVVEARVATADIEHVQPGADAEVRLSAYEYRAMPMLPGRVATVSADRVTDASGEQTWFAIQVEVDASELDAYPGARMHAGMPAEVYVTTEPRSLLDYVIRPLTSFAARGMREP